MAEVPDKAIYRCPEHGLFMVPTEGIIWRQRSCTKLVPSLSGREFPCGVLSPLAHVDDPDLLDKNKNIGGLSPDLIEQLRASIAAVREERKARERESGEEKPNFFFGGAHNRRNGRPLGLPPASEKDVEQELFEAAERERMRAAMNESWD